ncbi:hypothetical protein ACG7TL_006853 [Trametes sanguinea]
MAEAATNVESAAATLSGDPAAQGADAPQVEAAAVPVQEREKSTRVEVVRQPAQGDGSSDEEDNKEDEESEIEDSQILEDLPDETEDIELIHSRLSSASVSKLGLQRFGKHLKRLCLRQNFISHLDPEVFNALTAIEDLDFYDNKIKHVGSAFNNMSNLTTLDLSFNLLKHVPEELEQHLKSLRTVFFVQNRISHITNLTGLGATLRSLELGGNKIRQIEGLDALVNLEELWLGKNKITKLEGLDNLKKLKILSIQSNRITKLEGLEGLENLEELYLSHNGISKLEGLEKNPKLRTLDVGANFIEKVENVSHLTNLEELWMNDNKISTLQDLEPQLKHIKTLETVYLEGNPVQAAEGAHYRRKVILALPQIQQLDATDQPIESCTDRASANLGCGRNSVRPRRRNDDTRSPRTGPEAKERERESASNASLTIFTPCAIRCSRPVCEIYQLEISSQGLAPDLSLSVSASSFFDLKAELAKKEQEFAKNKAAGKSAAIVGGVKRDDKKISQWAKANPGVQARAARDIELEEISKPTLESARAILERKAKVYDKLRKGKSGGLNEKQYDALLVDVRIHLHLHPAEEMNLMSWWRQFEQKGIDPHFESDSDDVDESLTVPVPPGEAEADPVVEYEDEFGRVRTARRSEIPRHLLPQDEKEKEDDFETAPDNPVNHFPTFGPSQERIEKIRAEFAEENNPLNIHYDPTKEVRAKGAGFYQFSGDEETRRKQMEELRKVREETERVRKETGAEDVRPGEVEGLHPGAEDAAGLVKSRAMEKRKREIEERRKLLEAKRRKVATPKELKEDSIQPSAPVAVGSTSTPSAAAHPDPFAALEAHSTETKAKGKDAEPTINSADAFLAQLEQDIMKGKGR